MTDIRRIIVSNQRRKEILRQSLNYLFDSIHPANIFLVYSNDDVISVKDNTKYHYGNDAYSILDDMIGEKDLFSTYDTLATAKKFPKVKNYIITNQIHSFFLTRVGKKAIFMVFENSVTRMWQDHEYAILEYVATLLDLANIA